MNETEKNNEMSLVETVTPLSAEPKNADARELPACAEACGEEAAPCRESIECAVTVSEIPAADSRGEATAPAGEPAGQITASRTDEPGVPAAGTPSLNAADEPERLWDRAQDAFWTLWDRFLDKLIALKILEEARPEQTQQSAPGSAAPAGTGSGILHAEILPETDSPIRSPVPTAA